MALKLYRCLNPCCRPLNKGRFTAEKPICPQCKIEANDPKFGHLIVLLPRIHFDLPSKVPGYGEGVRACDPSKPIHGRVIQGMLVDAGTAKPQAVTCVACKETKAFKAALAAASAEGYNSTTAGMKHLLASGT